MRIPGIATALLLTAILCTTGRSQAIKKNDILRWQDQRRGVDSLILALDDPRTQIRTAAALALANIQDTTAVPALVGRLRDRDPGVREMAAFALGQTPSAASEQGLLNEIVSGGSRRGRSALLDALGRCGTTRSLDSVVALVASRNVPEEHAADALLRFSIRGVRSVGGVFAAFGFLKHGDPGVRWRATSALSRWAPHRWVDSAAALHGTTLAVLVDDRSAEVRMHLAALLGRSSEKGALILLQQLMAREPKRTEPDWRVQVNLARALALKAQRDLSVLPLAISMTDVPNDHVKIAALQALEQLPPAVLRDTTGRARLFNRAIRMLDSVSTESEQVRAEAFVLLGRLNGHEMAGAQELLASPQTSPWLKTKLLEAYGQQPSKRNISVLLKYLDDPSERLSTAAWDYLKRVLTPPVVETLSGDSIFWDPLGPLIAERAAASLRRGDMAVSTVTAMFFADTTVFRWFTAARQAGAVRQALHAALSRMSSDVDVEAMQAVIGTLGVVGDSTTVPHLRKCLADPDRTVVQEAVRALARLGVTQPESNVPTAVPPTHTDYDWALLKAAADRPTAEIVTTKGRIVIELLPGDAPFTTVSFIRLIRKQFFDGLLFHRVVPNFVVQGGDPRGDGWGGPGYSIRTEVSPRRYERGSVGVASAGKDTEGCQFFITHSTTPHLDGRYTIFARVTRGMEVVDRLQIGDRIESIRLN